jgi:hypothetical protein
VRDYGNEAGLDMSGFSVKGEVVSIFIIDTSCVSGINVTTCLRAIMSQPVFRRLCLYSQCTILYFSETKIWKLITVFVDV